MNKMIELNDKILKDYLLGKCTEEETIHILKWIRESDEHAAQLFKIEQLYHLGRFEEYTKKTEKAENHLMSKIKMIENKKSHRLQMMRWLKYAAIAVIILLVGNGYWNSHRHSLPELITAQALNKVQQITLPDGTKVWLNRTATLKYATRG
jgi:ferric-dicitrate binding protein FerR (iron transport regulator)